MWVFLFILPTNRQLLAPNNIPLKLGDILKQTLLADTLANISQYGSDYFYNSPFTSDMVKELQQDYGSILTEADFHNYTVQVRNVLSSQFSGLQVLGASPPSSGAVVALVLNILEGKHCLTHISVVVLSSVVNTISKIQDSIIADTP